jgi:hypothetical protein
MVLSEALPLNIETAEKRYQYLSRLGMQKLENVLISGKCSVQTNIGIIHDQGHPEPWIIAMSQSTT